MTVKRIEIASSLAVHASIRQLVEKQKKGDTSPEENAALHQHFVALAAQYNDLMYREYNHRIAYKCTADWKCACPVHKELSSACSHLLHARMEYLDYDGDKQGRLSSKWWHDRGFQLVLPGTDPVLDWVILANGQVPVPDGILEKAAGWWVNFLVGNLPGSQRPADLGRTLAIFEPTIFDPIDWTLELQGRLNTEIVAQLKGQFAAQKPPQAFAPLEISLARYGGSMSIFEACRKVGLGAPMITSDVTMQLTPASIRIAHKTWEA